MSEDRAAKGVALAKRMFGAAARGVPLPRAFSRRTMEEVFGGSWQGEELTLAERSLITCAALVALNREAEQRMHFIGARSLGVERAKLEAVIAHLAYYAGWPCAVSAFRALEEVWPEDTEGADGASPAGSTR